MTLEAARWAYMLLLYSLDKEPTLTPEGPYYLLTELLVEAATGKHAASVERACKKVRELVANGISPLALRELDLYQRATGH